MSGENNIRIDQAFNTIEVMQKRYYKNIHIISSSEHNPGDQIHADSMPFMQQSDNRGEPRS